MRSRHGRGTPASWSATGSLAAVRAELGMRLSWSRNLGVAARHRPIWTDAGGVIAVALWRGGAGRYG